MDASEAQAAYLSRINRVIEHILREPAGDLSLDALATLANFSPYHFHRVWKTHLGETLHAFVTRARLERSLFLLRTAPRKSLGQVALDCGFESSAHFSKVFKQHYGAAPSRVDIQDLLARQQPRDGVPSDLRYYLKPFPIEDAPPASMVTVERRGALRLAYVRVTGGYLDPGSLVRGYQQLEAWADEVALDRRESLLIGMSMDDPEIVPLERCRYDFCRSITGTLRPAAGMGLTTLPASDWAVLPVKGDIALVDRAWSYLFKHWLPASGWECAALPAMEVFLAQPEQIGWEQFDLLACVPVAPLATGCV
jgi:AraC family transcriptional regulator